jgi:Asp/Glu/hydantoin racemase
VTTLLEAAALRIAARERLARRIHAVTAGFGPRYITGEVGAAIAAHAAMEAYAAATQRLGPAGAVLLGCFGDPGLFALRALSPAPVLGLAESSMRAAAQHGPFVVVTGGAAWVPMLQRLAQALPLASPLLGVQAVPHSGGEMAAQPVQAIEWLAEAAALALRRWPAARAVLLGGAGLAGLAAPLASRVPVPVLDNVELAVGEALALASNPDPAPDPAPDRAPDVAPGSLPAGAEPGPWAGLSPALSLLLTGLPAP